MCRKAVRRSDSVWAGEYLFVLHSNQLLLLRALRPSRHFRKHRSDPQEWLAPLHPIEKQPIQNTWIWRLSCELGMICRLLSNYPRTATGSDASQG